MGCSSSLEKIQLKMLHLNLRRADINKERNSCLEELSKLTGHEVFRKPVIDYFIYPKEEIQSQRQDKTLLRNYNENLNKQNLFKFNSSSFINKSNHSNEISPKSNFKFSKDYTNRNYHSNINHFYMNSSFFNSQRKSNDINKRNVNLKGVNLYKHKLKNYWYRNKQGQYINHNNSMRSLLLNKPIKRNTNFPYDSTSNILSPELSNSLNQSLPFIHHRHRNNSTHYISKYNDISNDCNSIILKDRYNN